MKKSSLKSRSRDKEEEEEDFKKEQKKQPIQMTNDQMPKNTKAKKERDFVVQIIAEAKNRVWFFKKKKFVNLNISSSSSIILYIS